MVEQSPSIFPLRHLKIPIITRLHPDRPGFLILIVEVCREVTGARRLVPRRPIETPCRSTRKEDHGP